MLTTLSVSNLALVDKATVSFGPGLNVITGETGAGKSILVGALGLVLGERADKSLIRTGESQCTAEAVVQLADAAAIDAVLAAHGLDRCEDGQVILRRVVRTTGSQNFINGCPATLQTMKAVGRLLVDMHGPHDHQSLLDPDFQLEVLDAFGRHPNEQAAYAEAYRDLRGLDQQISALDGPDEGVAEQLDLLAYRIRELEEAALDPAEWESLQREHQTLGHAQEIAALGGAIGEGLVEGEASAFDTLAAVQRSLEELARLMPDAEPWREEARSIAGQLQALYQGLASALDGIESNPGRLEWLDERLALYRAMQRKYGGSVEACRQTLETSRARLRDLSTRGERLADLRRLRGLAEAGVKTAGAALHRKRKTAAGKLAREVTEQLRGLGFAHGVFAVSVNPGPMGPAGLDEIEFGFAPNVGEAMRPLRAIASSGEISRVMLATKRVLADLDRIPVLVFDEIDANIGGEMGTVVGRTLAELATTHQVLCITHLPQVAVFGQAHHAVAKSVRDGRTYTEVRPLDGEARVEEIARMLGGRGLTRVTLQHAREMIDRR